MTLDRDPWGPKLTPVQLHGALVLPDDTGNEFLVPDYLYIGETMAKNAILGEKIHFVSREHIFTCISVGDQGAQVAFVTPKSL